MDNCVSSCIHACTCYKLSTCSTHIIIHTYAQSRTCFVYSIDNFTGYGQNNKKKFLFLYKEQLMADVKQSKKNNIPNWFNKIKKQKKERKKKSKIEKIKPQTIAVTS